MPTPQKEATVAQLREHLDAAGGVYLAEFSGIGADAMTQLRATVSEAGGRLRVAKNRLLKLAVADSDYEGLSDYLTGPTALMFCTEDPIGPAKALKEFSKDLTEDRQSISLKAAFIDGSLFDTSGAQALADLPPLEGIKGAVVGAIAGPADALVYTLNAAASDLVFTLQAVADKREGE